MRDDGKETEKKVIGLKSNKKETTLLHVLFVLDEYNAV